MRTLAVGVAFAAGAALMYSFDPDHGRRRRARVRNEADHLMHAVPRSLRKAGADSAQRVHGMMLDLRRWPSSESVDDDVLSGRVRAGLGRYCSHPGAIRVSSQAGVVELRGPILAGEASDLVRHVCHLRGVLAVKDALEPHESSEGIPSLSGGRLRARPGLWRRRWPISVRWATGAGAAGLAASGLLRGGVIGAGLALAGGAAVLRAATDRPLTTLLGLGGSPESGIDVSKTVTVDAALADVFDYFVAFENFPRFMRHVREVRRVDDNRWHWTVEGAGGLTFDWDGVITHYEPYARVAWTSTERAAIRNHGEATFEPTADGKTRLTIRLVYNPPLGAVGHALARLLAADPKSELDDDMLRFKSLLERGKASGRAGSVTRDEVTPSKS
jgi:uncharacterized membrane protein